VTSDVPLKYTELFVVVKDEALVPPRAIESVPLHVGAKVKVPPEFVIERFRLVSDEVASVSAPVCAEPKDCWSEETPLLIEEVATQVGIPLKSARTWPFTPGEVVLSAPDPFPRRTVFAWRDAQPVPPFVAGRMPVTSAARLMSEVETVPAVALRKPLSAPMESVFDTLSADVEAKDETVRFEVVALDETRFVVVPVDTERFEMDDDAFTTIPMVVVGVSAPFWISHDLPKSCEMSAYAERSEKVGRPNDEVASCWYAPPAYEPRRIPAAVGFEIPVPPLPTASVPVQPGASVNVEPEFVIESVMFVSDEVARVSAPVCAEPKDCWSDETPLLIDEVATHVGMPLKSART
jgi:hypothetical protein